MLSHYEKFDPAHGFVKLAEATRGRSRKIVKPCLMKKSSAQALQQTLADLREAFGAPQLQDDATIKEIQEGPFLRKFMADSLEDFYVSFVACRNFLRSIKVAKESTSAF